MRSSASHARRPGADDPLGHHRLDQLERHRERLGRRSARMPARYSERGDLLLLEPQGHDVVVLAGLEVETRRPGSPMAPGVK
jgi:hypothetical protein